MTQNERWEQAKTLFMSAIDLPAGARDRYIAENCEDELLRQEVFRLLEGYQRGDRFLESPFGNQELLDAQNDSVVDPMIGQIIDDFRIVRRVGVGGMGTVYAAQQGHPKRMAAVKFLHVSAPLSKQDVRRFKQETKALARLQHPGLAHIYASGTRESEWGTQPWFAMELFDGAPLDQYLKEHELTLHEKLRLLLPVCDAVQHAHIQGVVHRDLKPANILVVSDSEQVDGVIPKIVDFGVARIMDGDGLASIHTAAGEIVGTLNYMSPEHVSADHTRIDARSDVYSLGVIGAEMLTGRLPFDRKASSLLETIRLIQTLDSVRLGRLKPDLRGDLEVIFAKCLDRDPDRRYATVGEFAEDLRRFLRMEPIVARRPSTAYLARKYVARNRVLVGGVVATIIALGIGLILFAVQAHRAQVAADASRYEAEKANAVSDFVTNDFMMKLLHAANGDSGRSRPDTAQLVEQAAANISPMFGNRPKIEAAVRNQVGTIYYNLSQFDRAANQFEKALDLWSSQLGVGHVDSLKAANNLGQCLMPLGQLEEAEVLFRRALAGRSDLLGESDPYTLATRNNLAELCRRTNRMDEAESLLRQALALQRQRGGKPDKNALIAMGNLGSLLIERGELEEGKALHLTVWETSRRMFGDDHVITLIAGSKAAQTLYRCDDFEGSLEILLPVLDGFRQLNGPDHQSTINIHRLMAKCYRKLDDSQSEQEHLETALAAAQKHPEALEGTIRKIKRDLGQGQ